MVDLLRASLMLMLMSETQETDTGRAWGKLMHCGNPVFNCPMWAQTQTECNTCVKDMLPSAGSNCTGPALRAC